MDPQNKIYLDYAATTPVDERVLAAMMPFFTQVFGNPSSIHTFGQQAEAALEDARQMVAAAIHAQPAEIVFTGCGTESDNLALRGAAFSQRKLRGAKHLLISPVEHSAVLATARALAQDEGFEVEYLPVDSAGQVSHEDVRAYLRPDTALVSVVYANNEIGTINPIAKIGQVCREANVLLHTDAVQAAAHLEMDVVRDAVDLLSLGAHKFYGPKGVGALYVRRGVSLLPAQTGGKQEQGLRAGTQNVPYIVGMATALRLAQEERAARAARLLPMRDALIARVLETIPRAHLTGHAVERLPNHASFAFEGADGNSLLMLLDVAGFACSSGSACRVGNPKPSDILLAIGLTPGWALGSLRVTLGKFTTPEHLDAFLAVLPDAVQKARTLAGGR